MPYRRSLACLAVAAAAFMQPSAVLAASDRDWTNVASVGVVDDANQAQVILDLHRARLGPGAISGTIRYNVTATEGLFLGADKRLTVRFYKPDNFTTITARLWSDEIATGVLTPLNAFTSAAYAASASVQTQSVTMNLPNDFDFGKKVYFIEVSLFRTPGPIGAPPMGDPRLEALQIDTF
jgi:hypothetical protein